LENERDYYFDNVKFILILLVVVGHIIEPLSGGQTLKPLYFWIYSFHMPLFIFVSGVFSKDIKSDDYARKLVSKLVLPYLIFESLYTVFDYWVFDREALVFSYFTPYWIMWYILCMIAWKVLLPYVVKFRYALPVSIAIAVLCGYANDAGYYASVSRTIVFFPFFLAGYYLEKQHIEKLISKAYRIVATIVAIIVFLAFYRYGHKAKIQWMLGSFSYASIGDDEWYAGIYRLGIYGLAALLSLCVLVLVTNRRIPLLTKLGQNTLYVYLLHGFIIKYLSQTNFYSLFTSSRSKASLIGIAIVLTIVLSTAFIKNIFRHLLEPALFKLIGYKQRVDRSNRLERDIDNYKG
jgi:fucose 4-O-acetylase-like acetyltransferase